MGVIKIDLSGLADELLEAALRGELPPPSPDAAEPPPPDDYREAEERPDGMLAAAEVAYPPEGEGEAGRFVKVIPRLTDGTGGWNTPRLIAASDGAVRFSGPEAQRIVRHIGETGWPPEGTRTIEPPPGWETEPNPYYEYYSGCDTEGEVFPSPNHYRRHRTAGEAPCPRAETENEIYSRFVELDDDGEETEWTPPGWKPYRGKKNPDSLPHRIYIIRFPEPPGGLPPDRYYGMTRKPITQRVFGHIHIDGAENGWRIMSGEPYTARMLSEHPNRAEAEAEEERLIRAGNPDGGRLTNRRHNPGQRRRRKGWGAGTIRLTPPEGG